MIEKSLNISGDLFLSMKYPKPLHNTIANILSGYYKRGRHFLMEYKKERMRNPSSRFSSKNPLSFLLETNGKIGCFEKESVFYFL
jgi:hypothetical protein